MSQEILIEDLSQGLSATEVKRYSRHLSLSEVGPEGQQKLKKSKILIVGAGGLGCPVGLYLAAAGIYALDNHIDRLKEDHSRAKKVRDILTTLNYIGKIKPVETNIVIFTLSDSNRNEAFSKHLESHGVQIISMGNDLWRITTHLDVNDESINFLESVLKSF